MATCYSFNGRKMNEVNYLIMMQILRSDFINFKHLISVFYNSIPVCLFVYFVFVFFFSGSEEEKGNKASKSLSFTKKRKRKRIISSMVDIGKVASLVC
jgi:ATP-dependent Zn protease